MKKGGKNHINVYEHIDKNCFVNICVNVSLIYSIETLAYLNSIILATFHLLDSSNDYHLNSTLFRRKSTFTIPHFSNFSNKKV